MKAERHKWNCAGPRWTTLSSVRRSVSFGLLASVASVAASILCGCASFSGSGSGKLDYAKRVRTLELELKRTRAQLDETKERNLVLEKREQLRSRLEDSSESQDAVPVPFAQASPVQATPALQQAVKRSSAAILPAPMPSQETVGARPAVSPRLSREPAIENVGSAATGEHFLYSKVLETFQKRNAAELQKSMQMLLRSYPDSVFADNALYLAGMLAFEIGDTARANTYFDRVLAEHPLGNKSVSALFAKAVIEKRNKKYNEARKLLEKVRAQYPGSQEALRAKLELQLLNVGES